MNIKEYKIFSDQMLSATERVKDKIRNNIEFHKNNYPERVIQ